MKKQLLTALIGAAILSGNTAIASDSKSFYRGGADNKIVTATNGAKVNKEYNDFMTKGVFAGAKITEVTDGVWTVSGYSLANYTFIEGKTGLIAFDSGSSVGMGKTVLEMVQKKVNKPVVALIYSHFHYTGGAKAYAASNPSGKIDIYAHPGVEKNMGGQGSTFRDAQNRRAGIQLGAYLPHSGPDAAFGPAEPQFKDAKLSAHGHLAATHEVKDGEKVNIDGIDFTFYHAVADTEDSLIVDIPSKDLVLHNSASAGMLFSLYTLRGSDYRTPVPMINSLDKVRSLNRKYVVGVHDFPTEGEKAQEILTAHRDAYAFIYNQSVRAINKGATPDEMAASIKLPTHLDQHAQLYPGYVDNEYNVRAQYRGIIGWFDEDISELHPPSRNELGRELLAVSGGADKLISAAKKAFADKKYNLSVKLYSIVVDAEPANKTAKLGMAAALRQMAQTTRAGIQTRSYLLTHALHLEGKLDINKQPKFKFFGSESTAEIMASAPGTSVKALEMKLDPNQVLDVESVVAVTFTDLDKSFSINIRKGAIEVSEGADKAEATLEIKRETWAKLAIGEASLKQLISSKQANIKGSKDMAYKVLGAFDNIEL
ncbi:alkyl sulfatase dimerization domain-containing protein [Vibrio breoganii]